MSILIEGDIYDPKLLKNIELLTIILKVDLILLQKLIQ